jgi:hypothetical protein
MARFPNDLSVLLRLRGERTVGAVVMLVMLGRDSVREVRLDARVEMLKLRERERDNEGWGSGGGEMVHW